MLNIGPVVSSDVVCAIVPEFGHGAAKEQLAAYDGKGL